MKLVKSGSEVQVVSRTLKTERMSRQKPCLHVYKT